MKDPRAFWAAPSAAALVFSLAACGGGSGSSQVSLLLPTKTCMDGVASNAVGADDVFSQNAWHLKNTGAAQVVSAAANFGVAGIDANVEGVHQEGRGCTGKGVTVAIVDSGMEIKHEDLAPNVLPKLSWNFLTGTDDPSPADTEFDHGTGVAGVAAASGWNGKGSRGTAPHASLLGFNLLQVLQGKPAAGGMSPEAAIFLTLGAKSLAGTGPGVSEFGSRADGVAVFNASAGADLASPPAVEDHPLESAMEIGTQNLRSGKGALYFRAAGNERRSVANSLLADGTTQAVDCAELRSSVETAFRGRFSNPDNLSCGNPTHDWRGQRTSFQVAAIHNNGKVTSYSSAGSSVWVTGFGGEFGTEEAAIITIDNSGCNAGTNNVALKADTLAQLGLQKARLLIADLFGEPGSKDPACNYTGRMNGTSAATPSVSGVAALMLEANPQLSWLDLAYILAKTSRKVDSGIVADAASAPTFTASGGSVAWPLDLPWLTNKAGFNFQNSYGFGLVDAKAAVQMAINFQTPQGRRPGALVSQVQQPVSTGLLQDGMRHYTAVARFADATALTGKLQLDLELTNKSGKAINMGALQFELTNKTTGTRSILIPAFTAWYAGGLKLPLVDQGQQKFRLFTNAYLGETLGGDFEVRVVDMLGQTGASGLSFSPVLTSHSL